MSAENISLLAKMIVANGNNQWPDIYHKAMGSPLELINRPQYQKYDFGRYLDNVNHGGLIDLFYCYAYRDGFIDMVDWQGEEVDGQIVGFVVQRMATFRPEIDLGACLNELQHLTEYDGGRDKDFAAGDSVIDQFFKISAYLKPLGLAFGCINIGWDSYLTFVTPLANMDVLLTIDDHHFTIQGFNELS